MTLVDRRTTRYLTAVKRVVDSYGHASNADIVNVLRQDFPNISATTVHRVTQRLYEDGEVRKAPSTIEGAIRYDSNVHAHDHFMCTMCGEIRDVALPNACRMIIQCNLDDCSISGPLTVSGICKRCSDKWKE